MNTSFRGNTLTQNQIERVMHQIYVKHFFCVGITFSYDVGKEKSLCAAIHKMEITPMSSLHQQLKQSPGKILVKLFSTGESYTVTIHRSVGTKEKLDIIRGLHLSQLN